MTQDELKALVGQAALKYVVPGEIVGVGTGSTVNKFIDALATMKDQIKGAVSSSLASTKRLQALGIPVFDANEVDELAVYIDGADIYSASHNSHYFWHGRKHPMVKRCLAISDHHSTIFYVLQEGLAL